MEEFKIPRVFLETGDQVPEILFEQPGNSDKRVFGLLVHDI